MDIRRMFTYDHNSKNDSDGAKLCDVAYWDGSSVKTTSMDNWSTSLGTPIGVVVIPSGILPDGMARIMRVASVNGAWQSQSDTVLKNYTKVPTTNNIDEKISSSSTYGYLPSDSFSGEQSFVDPKSFYNTSATLYLPSPWLGDKFNPGYNCEISNQLNALGDFNGDLNTSTLNNLGIFNSIRYSDGASSLKWYIPALGELGYIMPRAAEIIKIFDLLSTYASFSTFSGNIWSSTEYDSQKAWYLNFDNGHVGARYKTYAHKILLFAKLERDSQSLITFTVDGTEYQAEEGMTWGEWVDSEYSPSTFITSGELVAHASHIGARVRLGQNYVLVSNIIMSVNYNIYDPSSE